MWRVLLRNDGFLDTSATLARYGVVTGDTLCVLAVAAKATSSRGAPRALGGGGPCLA